MKTRTEYACYIENNDFIAEDGVVLGYVYALVDDAADHITFDMVDENDEHFMLRRGPFDQLQVVEWDEEEPDDYDWNENNRIEEEMYGPNPR